MCATFGIGLAMHPNSHLGISLAAMVHLAAATPTLSYACDTHSPWASEDVVVDPLRVRAGAVTVPDAPGPGVTLDPVALNRMHRRYPECGITSRDDAGYLRNFQPDFKPRRAAW